MRRKRLGRVAVSSARLVACTCLVSFCACSRGIGGRLYTDEYWHIGLRPAVYCETDRSGEVARHSGLPLSCNGVGFTFQVTTSKVP